MDFSFFGEATGAPFLYILELMLFVQSEAAEPENMINHQNGALPKSHNKSPIG